MDEASLPLTLRSLGRRKETFRLSLTWGMRESGSASPQAVAQPCWSAGPGSGAGGGPPLTVRKGLPSRLSSSSSGNWHKAVTSPSWLLAQRRTRRCDRPRLAGSVSSWLLERSSSWSCVRRLRSLGSKCSESSFSPDKLGGGRHGGLRGLGRPHTRGSPGRLGRLVRQRSSGAHSRALLKCSNHFTRVYSCPPPNAFPDPLRGLLRAAQGLKN